VLVKILALWINTLGDQSLKQLWKIMRQSSLMWFHKQRTSRSQNVLWFPEFNISRKIELSCFWTLAFHVV